MRLFFHRRPRFAVAVVLGISAMALAMGAAIIQKVELVAFPTALSRTVVVGSPPQPLPLLLPESLPCRKDPFATLQHDPKIFVLLAPCQTASGLVAQTFRNDDGDIHVHIFPDDSSKVLLNDVNRGQILGLLVLEVTPRDQKTVVIPKIGQHIEAVGAWVTDKYHGWNELHPVWGLHIIDNEK